MANIDTASALHRLAERFDAEFRTASGPSSVGAGGWGQFLDAMKRDGQIGPYGTSAGIVVLALAGRLSSPRVREASELLSRWWESRAADDYAAPRFSQNLRLALANLALRLARSDISSQVEEELLTRLLPSGLWGNYWWSATVRDDSPRVFVSSLIVLSFVLFRDAAAPIDARIRTAAEILSENLESTPRLPAFERAAAIAAVIAVRGKAVPKRIRRLVSRVALGSRPELMDRGNYFFDYEYAYDGKQLWGRDYFVVPTALLLSIAGCLPDSPPVLRLRAEAFTRLVRTNLDGNGGALRLYEGERLSTVDQLWCAVLLRAAAIPAPPPSGPKWLSYQLCRARRNNVVTSQIIPVVGMVVATVAFAVVGPNEPWLKGLTGIAMFVIYGLYGYPVIKRVIPTSE
jgi:hypothetical protein